MRRKGLGLKIVVALAANALVAVCIASSATAANFTVNTTNYDGPGSLQNALLFANDNVNFPGHNTITITANGTYVVPPGGQLGFIFGDVDIIGPGAANFTITGGDDMRGLPLLTADSPHVSISGIKIEGANTHDQIGGALRNQGDLTLNGVVIRGNISDIAGGGIYNEGTLTLNGSTIGPYNTSPEGGGIANDHGTVTLNASTVTQNSAGGVVNENGGTLNVNDSTLSSNSTSSGGGAIHNSAGTTASVNGSTLTANIANGTVGGGAINNQGTLTVTNSTLTQNTAQGFGGAIDTYNSSGTAHTTLASDTITNNTADSDSAGGGNGGGLQNGEATGAVQLTNTLLALNTTGTSGTGAQCFGFDLASGGHNLTTTAPGCNGLAADLTAAPGTISGALGPLAPNGGPTQTLALLAGSPAINAGAGCPATDQRGFLRAGVAPCDIGAFELGAVAPSPATPAPPIVGGTSAKKCKKKKKHRSTASAAKKKKCKKKKKR
jgi:hypothetical protein